MSGLSGAIIFVVVLCIAFAVAFTAREKGLRRSSSDCVFGGVCAGIADYFDIQPWLVRLLMFIGLLSTGGVFLLFYLVLAGVLNTD